ncbi:iron-containing redox enzyme family protein [soil metagenome]
MALPMPRLPDPRGETSEVILDALRRRPAHDALPAHTPAAPYDPLADEDLQLSLYLCYELHYRGLDGVDERWEWSPALLALRAALEERFEAGLHSVLGPPAETVAAEETDRALREIAEEDDAPSLSTWIERTAELEHVREFLVHRSAYQLKEADPHSWAIPRLSGAPKAALIEIQADEYGGGRAPRIHAELFARAMEALGLERTYGAYLDAIPGVTLATVNLMSLFGLHRRWRGAIVGHLALFEMTSSIPNGRYARGLRRLGFDGDAVDFFDEHVEADAVHENIAAVNLAGGLVDQEPALGADVLWGARALALLDARWTTHVLDRWAAEETSLRLPVAEGNG